MESRIKPVKSRCAAKKLRVIFPDGECLCYGTTKTTFLETLKRIDNNLFPSVKLEIGHLPIISQVIHDKYKKYMEPIGNGWYVNTQSDTEIKYMQLSIINEQFNLGLQIDMSADFKGERVIRGERKMKGIQVTFPNGSVIGEESVTDTFIACIWEFGVDNVKRTNIQHGGKPLITLTSQYNGQVQIDKNRWLIIPSNLKDKIKVLKVIGAYLNIDLKIENLTF